jgi:hypothetical protein
MFSTTFLRKALLISIRFTSSKVAPSYSKKREQCVGKDVLHAGAPGVDPDLAEGREKPRDYQVALVVADVLHHVEGSGYSMSNGAK